MTIERALREAPELKNLTETDPQIRQLLSLAQKVEGCVRHASIHAAGVVISPTPLNDYVPLQYDVEGKHIITQYDMWSCEDVGLVKMDFLGIRNLSIMGSAVNIIKKTKGLDIDLAAIPLNDKKTYDLMAKGETMGIFQLGGSGMTRYLKELKPSTITDVMAMVALFRPGPMESLPEFIRRKHNPKAITYLDPRLKEILKDSYGIITYQDDVLMIAVKLAGYTWEEADKLRKAMGKKIPREMARQKEKFISGCIVGGLSETKANQLWELIEPFAAYGFNKAHAASYGIVAYQTAYLKANFPTEFMAALMTAESDDLPTVAQAVAECKRLNITVLPPDVNESLATFTVVNDKCIRFGLSAIKNLGAQVIENIIAERKLNGPFVSLVDFIERAARREFTKKSLESLIKCGALDSFGFDRGQLLAAMETLLSHAKNSQRAKIAKQSSLFGSSKTEHLTLRLPETPPASQKAKLTWEKEFLGLYVTKHPLQEYMTQLNGRVVPISELDSLSGEPMITIAGLVTATKAVTTKKGELMMFATLEDLNGTCELIAFPDTYRNERDKLVTDAIVAVRGRLSKKNGERKVIIESIISLPKAEETTKQLNAWLNGSNSSKPSDDQALTIILPADTSPEIMAELKKLLEHHSGKQRVVLEIKQTGKSQRVNTPYKVDPTPEFIKQCQSLLGYSSLPFTT
jgi:DNA polymerase-3 subunit alpha